MSELVLSFGDVEVGRAWTGMEYVHVRKLRKGGYSIRVTYKRFNGYRTTILRARRFETISEAFEYVGDYYRLDFIIRLFLKHAGEEWAEEKEELRGLLHVPDCS